MGCQGQSQYAGAIFEKRFDRISRALRPLQPESRCQVDRCDELWTAAQAFDPVWPNVEQLSVVFELPSAERVRSSVRWNQRCRQVPRFESDDDVPVPRRRYRDLPGVEVDGSSHKPAVRNLGKLSDECREVVHRHGLNIGEKFWGEKFSLDICMIEETRR